MIRISVGVFMVLHGLVHLLYLGQSARFFELQSGMDWPNGAWAFSSILDVESIRMMANILLGIAALMFIGGGAGILFDQDWWRLAVSAAAIFSSVIYILLWNGKFDHLADKGWVGILINLVILAALVLL